MCRTVSRPADQPSLPAETEAAAVTEPAGARLDPARLPPCQCLPGLGQDHTCCYSSGSHGRVESSQAKTSCFHHHLHHNHHHQHLLLLHATRSSPALPPPLASHCLSCLCLALSSSPLSTSSSPSPLQTAASS